MSKKPTPEALAKRGFKYAENGQIVPIDMKVHPAVQKAEEAAINKPKPIFNKGWDDKEYKELLPGKRVGFKLSEEPIKMIIKNPNSAGMNGLNILALDVATKTGWATKNAYGLWDFTIKRDESNGMKFLRFRSKLKEVCELESINVITFERSSGMHQSSVIHQSEMHGVLKLFCEENHIDYKAYSATEVKKFACGKGNANKQAMVAAAASKYGYTGGDDNVADALHIYHLSVLDLG